MSAADGGPSYHEATAKSAAELTLDPRSSSLYEGSAELSGSGNGCRTWIRTMTNRSRVCCATVTPSGNPGREAEARIPAP